MDTNKDCKSCASKETCDLRFSNIEKILDIQQQNINDLFESKNKNRDNITRLITRFDNVIEKIEEYKDSLKDINTKISSLDEKIDTYHKYESQKFEKYKYLIFSTIIVALIGYVLTQIGLK